MIRGPISFVIVGLISVVMFVMVALGPRAFEGYLPEAVLTLLDGGEMRSFSDGGGIAGLFGGRTSGKTPADFLEDDPGGWIARGPIAALSGNRPVFISDVIDGYRTQIAADVPAEITTIRPVTGCRLTPPQAGTIVGHAVAGSSELDLALLTYDDADLAEGVQQFVDAYRASDLARPQNGAALDYQAYDVAVTETAGPVYLVLFNWYGHRIWNIHLAPGARVERVVLLGGDEAGVANLDPVVPVEVIAADGLADCGIVPAYPVNPNSNIVTGSEAGGTQTADAGVAPTRGQPLQDAVAAYDTWFRDSFGVKASDVRAGFDAGTISVVGPVPVDTAARAVYAPVQGARIKTTRDKYFEIEGQVADAETFAGRVLAIATTFAFGELSYIRQGVSF